MYTECKNTIDDKNRLIPQSKRKNVDDLIEEIIDGYVSIHDVDVSDLVRIAVRFDISIYRDELIDWLRFSVYNKICELRDSLFYSKDITDICWIALRDRAWLRGEEYDERESVELSDMRSARIDELTRLNASKEKWIKQDNAKRRKNRNRLKRNK